MTEKEELDAIQKQRDEYGNELRTIATRQSEIREEIKGRHVRPQRYLDLVAEQESLKRRKLYLESQIGPLKRRAHDLSMQIDLKKPKTVRVGNLDEFDLSNALMEPTTLLQRAYSRLTRLTATYGRTDEDRGLLDSLHDYLYRNGIVLDRQRTEVPR